MSSISFAESISQSITNVVTNIVTAAQNVMWNATKINGQLWLWMPTWLKITLLIIALGILFALIRFAWKHRDFWSEIIEGTI